MPVVDDERQLPMFPGDNPREALLFHVIEVLAEGNRVLSAIAAGAQELEAQRQRRTVKEPTPEKRLHQPREKEFRTWGGFRDYFQKLERVLRREHHLAPDADVTKEMFYAAGAPSPKTITRIMVETYGLKADHWPPSTWPADLPAST